MNFWKTGALTSAAICISTSALAVSVAPTDYSTVNGQTGRYKYFDDSYNGTGSTTTSSASLSGGVGDLTDGVIATADWYVGGQTGANPYIGWYYTATLNPTVTFNFAEVLSFNSATVFFADSEGYGGVDQPASISVNGVNFAVPEPATTGVPSSIILDITGQVTNQLTMQFFHNDRWIFVSEVQFDAAGVSTVPLPAGGGLLAASMIAFAALRRRRTARQHA